MSKTKKITKTTIKQATDARSWQRGVNYHNSGRVQSLIIDGDEITAKVSGTYNYKVILQIQDNDIDGDCTCPMGDGGYFCKHCVAVALAYLDDEGQVISNNKQKHKKQKNTNKVTIEDIRQYLTGKKKNELVNMLIEQVKHDDHFREKLFLLLAARHKGKIATETFREAIEQATSVPDFDYGYDGYHDHENGRDIGIVIDSIEGLLEDGNAKEVMELAECAIDRCDSAMGYMDDHSGEMYNNIERLVDLFYRACQMAKPDPEEFARKLFILSLQSEWFSGAIQDCAGILGKKGMEIYRELALKQWDKVPNLSKGDQKIYGGERRRITSIMELLAQIDNDIEMTVAIKCKTLIDPWDYLNIAKIYKNNKQRNKALEWAEKAVKVFGKKEAMRSAGEFLAEEYHYRKRHDEAMKIVWEDFCENVSLNKYQNLKKHATRCKQWKHWRNKAMEYIEAEIGKGMRKAQKSRWSFSRFSDGSLLVEIFLWEKSPDKAWQEAQVGGCSTDLWLKLAKQRENKHPADSIKIYQSVIEPIVERTNNEAYREAVGYIKTIKKLMTNLKKNKEFDSYLAGIKAAFKRKRNFMKLLKKV